jgi:hypothetical protein
MHTKENTAVLHGGGTCEQYTQISETKPHSSYVTYLSMLGSHFIIMVPEPHCVLLTDHDSYNTH